jgi:putative solute:sodium symporter small subunit
MAEIRSPNDPAPARRHWRATRRLTAVLLAAWAAVGFGVAFFARDLSFDFFGWPFSFWVAAQGAGLFFAAIIAVYAIAMNRLDAALAQETDAAAPPAEGRPR